MLRQLAQTLNKTLVYDCFKVHFFGLIRSEVSLEVFHEPGYVLGPIAGFASFDLGGGRSPILGGSILLWAIARHVPLLVAPEAGTTRHVVFLFFLAKRGKTTPLCLGPVDVHGVRMSLGSLTLLIKS